MQIQTVSMTNMSKPLNTFLCIPGSVVAGLTGNKVVHYCLYGPAVGIAASLEKSAEGTISKINNVAFNLLT